MSPSPKAPLSVPPPPGLAAAGLGSPSSGPAAARIALRIRHDQLDTA